MEDVTELGLKETRCECMEWIHVARDSKQRRGLVKTGSYDVGTVLAQLHGVSQGAVFWRRSKQSGHACLHV
jgi:hypothetical protein